MTSASPSHSHELHAYEFPQDVHRMEPAERRGAPLPPLYVAGDVGLLTRSCVAVVGSRRATLAGQAAACAIAGGLASMGIVVVSGLAEGIDAAAHAGAMATSGGRTVAVIGTPLERVYPRQHARLQEAIAREHLLVSPFAAGTGTKPGHFPARNRVMARLSDAMVLVEAGESSGTAHQVRETLALGRPVLVAERLVNEVAWIAQLATEGRVRVWSTPRHAVERIAEHAA